MNAFEILMDGLIDEMPRTETDKAIDAAIDALIAKAKAGEDCIEEENVLCGYIGAKMNQLYELGVRQGIQLVTEALTNSAKQVRRNG